MATLNERTRRAQQKQRVLPIPVDAARDIAHRYGYDQVVVYARRVGEAGEPHGEHMTTYGVDRENCRVAASIGATLKGWMGWNDAEVVSADGEDGDG